MNTSFHQLFAQGQTTLAFTMALEDAVLARFEALFGNIPPRLLGNRLGLVAEIYQDTDFTAILADAPGALLCMARAVQVVGEEWLHRMERGSDRDESNQLRERIVKALGEDSESEDQALAGIDVRRALEALEQENRLWLQIILLQTWGGFTLTETAQALELTVMAVRERKKKAVAFLGEHLGVAS